MTVVCAVRVPFPRLRFSHDPRVVDLEISEGAHHQVKRMWHTRGNYVVNLHRVSIGPIELDATLGPGEVRPLTVDEQRILYRACSFEYSFYAACLPPEPKAAPPPVDVPLSAEEAAALSEFSSLSMMDDDAEQ